jgi:CheY-like chemotaxis protein
MRTDFAVVTLRQEVFLVEDEGLARASLTRILKGRGYEVTSAGNASEAVLEARKGSVSVVVMDIVLGEGLDGIEAAEEIQEIHPLTSFIFVSAHANDLKYREMADRRQIRVGGWIEKPILGERIGELVEKIEYERRKLEMLASLQIVEEKGGNPYEYIRSQETFLTPRLVEDVFAEYELRPLGESDNPPDLKAIAREIDEVYAQIRALIRERSNDQDLKEAARPLRERLRVLQAQEAQAIERHVRAHLRFDPRKGRELLDRAERLLKNQ